LVIDVVSYREKRESKDLGVGVGQTLETDLGERELNEWIWPRTKTVPGSPEHKTLRIYRLADKEGLSSVEIVSSLSDVPGVLATGLSNWLSAVVSMSLAT